MINRSLRQLIRLYAVKVVPTPYMADSITQGTIGSWERKVGDMVKQDDLVANIETDKVTIPVNSPEAGKIIELCAKEGDTVEVGSDLFKIDTDATVAASDGPKQPKVEEKKEAKVQKQPTVEKTNLPEKKQEIVVDKKTQSNQIPRDPKQNQPLKDISGGRPETREKLTRMRLRIAERMKEAQNTAASLTTFNEADMSEVIRLREKYKEKFVKEHNVKLGFMSIFMKACAVALQEMPVVNSRLDDDELIIPNYVDISVAVATPKGLVTPVVKNCQEKSFAALEKELSEFSVKARDNKISIEELTGGTFTISNGGVFGSMMGTPILNMPQVAILGMHAIKDRPVVINLNDGTKEIAIRPMMYLALTYDHRIIDGREAATFLMRVKELIEDPGRLLVDL